MTLMYTLSRINKPMRQYHFHHGWRVCLWRHIAPCRPFWLTITGYTEESRLIEIAIQQGSCCYLFIVPNKSKDPKGVLQGAYRNFVTSLVGCVCDYNSHSIVNFQTRIDLSDMKHAIPCRFIKEESNDAIHFY